MAGMELDKIIGAGAELDVRGIDHLSDPSRLGKLLDMQQLVVLPSKGAPGEYTEDDAEMITLRLNLNDGSESKSVLVHSNATSADVTKGMADLLAKDKRDEAYRLRMEAHALWYAEGAQNDMSHRAIELWKESAEMDDYISNYWLFLAYSGAINESSDSASSNQLKANPQNALSNLKAAAEAGFGPAQFQLGKSYYVGERGLQKNIERTCHYWTMAAENDHAMAQHNMAAMHFNKTAVGCPRSAVHNLEIAAKWFKAAALKDHEGSRDCYRKCLKKLMNVKALEASGGSVHSASALALEAPKVNRKTAKKEANKIQKWRDQLQDFDSTAADMLAAADAADKLVTQRKSSGRIAQADELASLAKSLRVVGDSKSRLEANSAAEREEKEAKDGLKAGAHALASSLMERGHEELAGMVARIAKGVEHVLQDVDPSEVDPEDVSCVLANAKAAVGELQAAGLVDEAAQMDEMVTVGFKYAELFKARSLEPVA